MSYVGENLNSSQVIARNYENTQESLNEKSFNFFWRPFGCFFIPSRSARRAGCLERRKIPSDVNVRGRPCAQLYIYTRTYVQIRFASFYRVSRRYRAPLRVS